MKILLILAVLLCNVCADNVYLRSIGKVHVEDRWAVKELRREFNRYDEKRLVHLSDSLLDGVIDLTLPADSMVRLFVSTSKMSGDVNVRFENLGENIGGFYRPLDSVLVINKRVCRKNDVFSVLIHELTHSIQHNYGFLSYGRKTIIVNELYADYISGRMTRSIGFIGYRQSIPVIGSYIDRFFQTEARLMSQYQIVIHMYDYITERLEK